MTKCHFDTMYVSKETIWNKISIAQSMMTSQILKFGFIKDKKPNNLQSEKKNYLHIKGYNAYWWEKSMKTIENKVRYVQWKKIFSWWKWPLTLWKHLYLQPLFCLLINGCCNFCRSHHPLLQLRNVVIVISSCDIFELGEI